jgi:hypothetical protein
VQVLVCDDGNEDADDATSEGTLKKVFFALAL